MYHNVNHTYNLFCTPGNVSMKENMNDNRAQKKRIIITYFRTYHGSTDYDWINNYAHLSTK